MSELNDVERGAVQLLLRGRDPPTPWPPKMTSAVRIIEHLAGLVRTLYGDVARLQAIEADRRTELAEARREVEDLLAAKKEFEALAESRREV